MGLLVGISEIIQIEWMVLLVEWGKSLFTQYTQGIYWSSWLFDSNQISADRNEYKKNKFWFILYKLSSSGRHINNSRFVYFVLLLVFFLFVFSLLRFWWFAWSGPNSEYLYPPYRLIFNLRWIVRSSASWLSAKIYIFRPFLASFGRWNYFSVAALFVGTL